jgi:hypothetical protein
MDRRVTFIKTIFLMWDWSQNLIHDSSSLHTDSGCNVVNDCDSNAQCLLDPATEEHHCRCNAGFSGDGKTCVAEPIGCNVINSCHIAADCVYDQGATGYRCRCKKVRTCKMTDWLHYWQCVTVCYNSVWYAWCAGTWPASGSGRKSQSSPQLIYNM